MSNMDKQELAVLHRFTVEYLVEQEAIIFLSVHGKPVFKSIDVKTFKGLAEQGKTAMGVILEHGEDFRMADLIFALGDILSITTSINAPFVPINVKKVKWHG